MMDAFLKLSLYVFNKIKKLKICCVVPVPKKNHFEVVGFEPKHPIECSRVNLVNNDEVKC